MKETVGTATTGLMFGFALSSIGFSSWDEVNAMFTLSSYRLTLAFLLGAAVLAIAWRVIVAVQHPDWSMRGFHPGIIPGSLLFGIGWAISGACPSIALVQLGEGQIGGLLTLVGIFAGNAAYSLAHERYFRWQASSCLDD